MAGWIVAVIFCLLWLNARAVASRRAETLGQLYERLGNRKRLIGRLRLAMRDHGLPTESVMNGIDPRVALKRAEMEGMRKRG